MCWNMGRKQQRAKAPVLKRRRRVNLVVEEEEVGGGRICSGPVSTWWSPSLVVSGAPPPLPCAWVVGVGEREKDKACVGRGGQWGGVIHVV